MKTEGEIASARAAGRAGIPFSLSNRAWFRLKTYHRLTRTAATVFSPIWREIASVR
ncbi:hypothetical protein [Mycolicibacterium iranicum]|uniref:hypothetical protein n=1 Tax=Mycolicibacterium iranicum TaxID=912594 RepID=UPI002E16509E